MTEKIVHVTAPQNQTNLAPVQTPPPPAPVGRDKDGDNDNGADDKVKAANPAGVGGLLDVNA